MFAYCLNRPWIRLLVVAASFVSTTLVMLFVGAAFDHVSREPVLRDTPQAREAVARCDALAARPQRDRCVHQLIAEAVARDAGAAQLAALDAHRHPAN